MSAETSLKTVGSPTGTFTYTYTNGLSGTDSPLLVGSIGLPTGALITNLYDSNGRMLSTQLANGTNLDFIGYTNNGGNQRVAQVRGSIGATNQVAYTYDKIGQLLSDLASENGGVTTRSNEQVKYAYDAAGNLFYRTNNGLIQRFNVNNLNELTSNTNGAKMTIIGTTTEPMQSGSSITVNSTSGAFYADGAFAVPGVTVGNTTYTASATDNYGRHGTASISVNIATNVTFTNDSNGNLTNDGVRIFAYDDENQLIGVGVPTLWSNAFTYDGKMRRRSTTNYTWTGSTWSATNAIHYLYDGNVVIQELNSGNTVEATYVRGLDLSGDMQGAGGIGGLLAVTNGAWSQAFYYHSDGNGNVTMLITPTNSIAARYLYDAFGNILAKSGMMADTNLYRFSSKEADANSGLAYYLYRFYDPNLQRWLNRDPIKEDGGVNLYAFVGNDPVDTGDIWGLAGMSKPCDQNKALAALCSIQCKDQGGVKSCSYTQSAVWNNGKPTYQYNMDCRCNGTPKPPAPPTWCPVPRRFTPPNLGPLPPGFWPTVGIGIGIGIGCAICPECCVLAPIIL